MEQDMDRVRANVKAASTQDLIERVTASRAGMEPAAILIIEDELERRGVSAAELVRHRQEWESKGLRDAQGRPLACWWCARPAVTRKRTWWRLWRLIPLFPVTLPACEDHRG
jgi:hypothetical protein